ncbi:hypothetical protein CRG98_038172 [Punica granatum]|uniref:Uncharacterized protein n=1 Tax=Punica granatum TaxID=22663 RepID=A0A2I0IBR9_PUNGR|nr:hypothetical protein CRG98_038172 [Punica granatum]
MFGQAGTRGRTYSGMHGRGRNSGGRLDVREYRRAHGAGAGNASEQGDGGLAWGGCPWAACGSTAKEGKPRESSGLDWSRIRSSWFELNVEL